jgi:hypothetical protein
MENGPHPVASSSQSPVVVSPAPPPIPAPRPANPGEPLSATLDSVGRNKDAIIAIVKGVSQEIHQARTTHLGNSRHLSWLIVVFLGVVVVGAGALVFAGRMSDGSFTFLLGVMIGYLMQFVDRINFGGAE